MSDHPIEEQILNQEFDEGVFTYRQYLVIKAILGGASLWSAIEAVSSTAIEHPEWDLEEEKKWKEWEVDEVNR